jgi:hypothetical protein
VIDTPSQLMEKGGMDLLTDAIQDFKGIFLILKTVNVILVIGNERLLSDLQRKYSSVDSMTILKLNKSGGVGFLVNNRSCPETRPQGVIFTCRG